MKKMGKILFILKGTRNLYYPHGPIILYFRPILKIQLGPIRKRDRPNKKGGIGPNYSGRLEGPGPTVVSKIFFFSLFTSVEGVLGGKEDWTARRAVVPQRQLRIRGVFLESYVFLSISKL